MKLLGWMHRKLRQNSGEPPKEFSIGHSCSCLTGQPSLDDQQYYYPKPNYCSRPLSKSQRDNNLRKSFASLEAAGADDDDLGEESSAFSELFHGFLAIGTLGGDPVIADPSTPTFSISVENITEKETEVTENELRLINEELEKVLGADGKEDGSNDSSGRNSHVSTGRNSHVSTGRNSHGSTGRSSHGSTGRSSHGSTITLSGKPFEGTESNGNGSIIFPLQGYLFGTAIGMPETTPKKEHRTSLGELFQKTKMTEENYGTKYDRGEKRSEKESDKSAVQLMKKILKKKMIHASSRSSTAASGGTIDSASADKKLHKILHMFHRKVHPQSSVATVKSGKSRKNETKSYITNEECYNDGNQMPQGEDITIFPHRALSRKSIGHFKGQCNPPQVTLGGSDSNGNRECWIKTDADYLVLEL